MTMFMANMNMPLIMIDNVDDVSNAFLKSFDTYILNPNRTMKNTIDHPLPSKPLVRSLLTAWKNGSISVAEVTLVKLYGAGILLRSPVFPPGCDCKPE